MHHTFDPRHLRSMLRFAAVASILCTLFIAWFYFTATCLIGCSGQPSKLPPSVAESIAICIAKGNAIVAGDVASGEPCETTVMKLNALIARDPNCAPYAKGSAHVLDGLCLSGGVDGGVVDPSAPGPADAPRGK